jgi:dUTP pyrophosphatase
MSENDPKSESKSESESEPEFYLYELEKDLLINYNKFMRLKIFVDSTDNEVKKKYQESIYNHHLKLSQNFNNIDAGFDLFSPSTKIMSSAGVNKLDFQVICSAQIVRSNTYNTGFYMYPRSSISKSNIRLANNVGIIDAGYRGHLIGMFDVINNGETIINKFDRHVQICAPGLIPIIVELVETREELGENTVRGDGGFGSTGI